MTEMFKNYNGRLDLALLQKSTQTKMLFGSERLEHSCIIIHDEKSGKSLGVSATL